ncbi:GGDEF domain-containing protein [Luteimonas sp. M1R5S18]|uniref:diguanylate cyclase n=1 Tax=Luteimonas rhizosphaericola TaxID=3042024 RepID=A0ABT6JNI9_9GAMM|nr:GGDEF domain-containing protein [Luteimonas rhizosphaericola]MDH5832249.1 GGDEF domain-containing protein [Luteimonas rhizosphaericola]
MGTGTRGRAAGRWQLSAGARAAGGGRREGLIAICLVLMLGLFAAAVAGGLPDPSGVQVQVQPLADAPPPADTPADAEYRAVRLRFDLPPRTPGSRWVVRLEREAVDAVWMQRDGWRSPTLGFFRPGADTGVLPSSYLFALPADWVGPVEVQLHTIGVQRRALYPVVMGEAQALQLEQYGIAASAMIYASLFTIGLLALALFSAARDRMFLALFAFTGVALLALSAVNGHLYQLPVLRGFAFWRTQGVIALVMLLCAAWLQMLLQYAGLAQRRARWKPLVDGVSLALVALVALCLLNLPQVSRVLATGQVVPFAIALGLGLVLLGDAARRRTLMALPLAALAVLVLAGVLVLELSSRGHLLDGVLVRYGYQLAIVVGVAILAVGLVGRIGEYRQQRDREQLERADSERRMQREAARAGLSSELQTRLRTLPAGDIPWTAFRLLIERLLPLMEVERCIVVTQGYHGQDALLVEPVADTDTVRSQLGRRQLALKRQAANGIPLQQPVTEAGAPSVLAIEAVVPLQIRAPAWGALLLQRRGADGFTTEELALAGDFARQTLQQIDQAMAAVQLRQSAELDALTGSFNRRTIDQWLARSFAEGARSGQPVSVLFLDLDHFKSINDRHGHACGDAALREVALALRGALQEGDLFGRYGGEEFIVILPGRNGAAARMVAEQLRMAVDDLRPDCNGQVLHLTVSVGVATRLEREDTPEATLERADRALYSAKAAGRNCVQVAPAVFR